MPNGNPIVIRFSAAIFLPADGKLSGEYWYNQEPGNWLSLLLNGAIGNVWTPGRPKQPHALGIRVHQADRFPVDSKILRSLERAHGVRGK
jgi:hypothetical protein